MYVDSAFPNSISEKWNARNLTQTWTLVTDSILYDNNRNAPQVLNTSCFISIW